MVVDEYHRLYAGGQTVEKPQFYPYITSSCTPVSAYSISRTGVLPWSQGSWRAGGKITGIRSWIYRMDGQAVRVRITKRSWPSRSCRERPARYSTRSGVRIACLIFAVPDCSHSKCQLTGIRYHPYCIGEKTRNYLVISQSVHSTIRSGNRSLLSGRLLT